MGTLRSLSQAYLVCGLGPHYGSWEYFIPVFLSHCGLECSLFSENVMREDGMGGRDPQGCSCPVPNVFLRLHSLSGYPVKAALQPPGMIPSQYLLKDPPGCGPQCSHPHPLEACVGTRYHQLSAADGKHLQSLKPATAGPLLGMWVSKHRVGALSTSGK